MSQPPMNRRQFLETLAYATGAYALGTNKMFGADANAPSVQPQPYKSGVRLDADSWKAYGLNGLRTMSVLSTLPDFDAYIGVKLNIDEENSNIFRNKELTDASLVIGMVPNIKSLREHYVNLNIERAFDGEAVRGGLAGLGFYVMSGAGIPAAVFAVAETGFQHLGKKMENRRVALSTIDSDSVPAQLNRTHPTRKVYDDNPANPKYSLALDTILDGKHPFRPDFFDVQYKQFQHPAVAESHHQKALKESYVFEMNLKDHRYKQNWTAFLAGLIAGRFYDLSKTSGNGLSGNPGGGTPTTPPGITGGPGSGMPTTPPRG